jgi:hypothetical protein
VICSITSSGLEMPPDQNESQMRSIWFVMSPVIMTVGALRAPGSVKGEELYLLVVRSAIVASVGLVRLTPRLVGMKRGFGSLTRRGLDGAMSAPARLTPAHRT